MIKNGYAWLIGATPTSAVEKVALVVALSDYHVVHQDASSRARIAGLLPTLQRPGSLAWEGLLSLTRLPDEAMRPPWNARKMGIPVRRNVDAALPDDVSAYFDMAITGYSQEQRHIGLQVTYLARLASEKQQPDGSFSSALHGGGERRAALFALSVAPFYHGAERFLPPPPTPPATSGEPAASELTL